MLILYVILILILILILKFIQIKNLYFAKFLKYLAIALSLSTILELTIFNFRHYESLFFYPKYQELNYAVHGLDCNNDICATLKNEESYLEIENINQTINNLYLDLTSSKNFIIDYEISFTDEASSLYLKGGTRTYVEKVNNSHYIKINPSGKVSKLKISLANSNQEFTIRKIAINNKTPFFISNIRLLLVMIITLLILFVNTHNIFHNVKFNNQKTKSITFIIITSLTLLFGFLTTFNLKTYTTDPTSHFSQYQNLAKALAKHQVYLDLKASDKLLSLPNPYDTKYRDSILTRYEDYYWDYSYYHGKYYSYFGIVPCLLTYLPYHVITNANLPNAIGITIAMLIFIIASFYLIYEIINKYFKNTSYIWYVYLSLFLVISSGYFLYAGEPTFYNQPIIYGVAFSLLGLAFWLKATNQNKLNSKYLFLGSLSMALVAGCRPQLLLSSFFALIIFKDYIFKKRELFSKKSLKETIAFITPFIVIAIFLMLYNYLRFGSIFDFGANYNLTTNDMTKRGFKLDRTFLGIYYFLFAPAKISPVFPFLMKEKILTSYIGKTIFENMHGGYFFLNLIGILGLLFFKLKKTINDEKLYKICKYSLIIAIIIAILDTQMAGILPRYEADFSWLLSLSTIIIILSLLKNNLNLDLKKVVVTLIFISLILNGLTFFLGRHLFESHYLLRLIYYKIYYSFMFWL